MKLHLFAGVSLLTLVLAPAALGQTTSTPLAPYLSAMRAPNAGGFEGFSKGMKSLSISGTVAHGSGGGTVGTVTGDLGYFFTSNVEAGLYGSGTWASVNGNDTSGGRIGIFGRYHFNSTTQMVPYVQGQVDWGVGDFDKSTEYGGSVGADWFFQPLTAAFAEFFVLGTSGGGDTAYGINFGLRIYVK